MTGLQLGSRVLMVKRAEPPSFEEIGDDAEGELIESEVFKDLFDVKPSCCLVMKNIVQVTENHEDEDFKELEFDVRDEMVRYGEVERVHVPRPPRFGDPFLLKGFGKVYVKFRSVDEA
jgi:hypothetical protein